MREARYLRQRYRTILSYTGLILFLCAGLMLTPLLALFGWPGESNQAWAFLLPACIMAAGGLTAWRLLRPKMRVVLTVQEGGVIVLLSWVAAILFSAWPLMSLAGLNFTQAVFESVSGWTTTGLSVVDLTKASHLVLLWRSNMQLAGGAGLAIIMLAAITGPTGPALSVAEGREQLVPHVRQSAKLVVMLYSGYAVLGIIALRLAGMNWWDAVNHCFPAISTGGFSTQVTNIGFYDSVAIEATCLVLMILGNLNFVTAWLLVRGKLLYVGRNGEVRLMGVLIPLSVVLVFLLTCRSLYPTLGKAARVALFETVSALTTTGFSTVPYVGNTFTLQTTDFSQYAYGNWNSFGWMTLIVLMLIGGGTCSTAGGIKQYRIYLLWKSLVWGLRRSLLPTTAVTENPVWEADRQVFVNDTRLRQIGTFVFLYLLTFAIGSAILASYGYGLKESLFEYASAVGTVGLSIGLTSPAAPAGVLWAETIGMFLGRLEFFVILTGAAKLVRDTWKMAVIN